MSIEVPVHFSSTERDAHLIIYQISNKFATVTEISAVEAPYERDFLPV